MRICLMIEGQEDVTWPEWEALAEACESAAGIEALFRSDHYQSVMGRTERGSLDAWATLSALAAKTESLHLGTMVSPASFRHPSVLAKNAVTAEHIAGGGRIELGLGAGWLETEHRAYGFPFLSTGERFSVLEEQAEIIARQLGDEPFDFEGEYYELEGSNALPKPLEGVHLIVGGRAKPRSLRLAARWAGEYNLVMMGPDEISECVPKVREAWEKEGRDAPVISLMTGCIPGTDDGDVAERVSAVEEIRGSAADDHWLVGTVDQIRQQLGELESLGVERVMLQYLPHRDLDGVALISELGS